MEHSNKEISTFEFLLKILNVKNNVKWLHNSIIQIQGLFRSMTNKKSLAVGQIINRSFENKVSIYVCYKFDEEDTYSKVYIQVLVLDSKDFKFISSRKDLLEVLVSKSRL